MRPPASAGSLLLGEALRGRGRKEKTRSAPACGADPGRGEGRLVCGAEKAGMWAAQVSNPTAWPRAIEFEESLVGNLSNPFSKLRPFT